MAEGSSARRKVVSRQIRDFSHTFPFRFTPSPSRDHPAHACPRGQPMIANAVSFLVTRSLIGPISKMLQSFLRFYTEFVSRSISAKGSRQGFSDEHQLG